MADSGSPMLFKEEELTCSICLDLFSDPVSTPCGHNFCQSCIGGYWATSPTSSCPLCKRAFTERPELSVNRIFAQITDSYKASRFGAAASARVITCDVCPGGRKLQAVWSCLTCCMSYCQEHAQPHLQAPYYSHHRLLEPHDAFRGRTCPTHHRLLEVYCCTDQESICAICVLEKHRTHRTVSVQMERVNKEKILRKTELEIENRIEEKTARLTELKGKIESLGNFALREAAEVGQILTEVSASVAQIRRELLGGIEEKQAAMEARGRELISQLEVDLKQLKDCSASLGQTAATEDHIGFLQSFQKAVALPLTEGAGPGAGPEPDLGLELRLPLSEVKQELREVLERLEGIHMGEGPTRHSSVLSESESMMSLPGLRKKEWSLRDLTRIRPGSGLKKVRAFSDDVTLNPLTAYPFLILSDDRKQLKRGEKQQSFRNSTQRYDVWSCVLAKEGFTSGRHYWEVNVGDNKDWKLGLVRESAKRKGLFDMTPNNGYYVLWWGCNQLRALTEPPLTKVKLFSRLRRVGVYLDHEEGQVTFYNAKSGSEVFAFSGLEFSERTLPLFGTGDKEVPLVLMTVHGNVPE